MKSDSPHPQCGVLVFAAHSQPHTQRDRHNGTKRALNAVDPRGLKPTHLTIDPIIARCTKPPGKCNGRNSVLSNAPAQNVYRAHGPSRQSGRYDVPMGPSHPLGQSPHGPQPIGPSLQGGPCCCCCCCGCWCCWCWCCCCGGCCG